MKRVSKEWIEDQKFALRTFAGTTEWQANFQALLTEVLLLREVEEAAAWQAYYHPKDTIEMVENSLNALKELT